MRQPEPELFQDGPDGRHGAAAIRRKGQLHATAVAALREMIVTGELPPGSRLRESEVGADLGVSRTPVREAFRTLAAEGLVRLLPNRSVVVAELESGDIDSLYQVFGALEGLAGELACQAITDEQLAEIGSLHYRMVLHHLRGERGDYFELNHAIHRKIVEAAANPVLTATWELLLPRVKRARCLANLDPERWQAAVDEHQKMFAALVTRDGGRLSELMRAHFDNGLAALKREERICSADHGRGE